MSLGDVLRSPERAHLRRAIGRERKRGPGFAGEGAGGAVRH
jgi:hypothetical protein